MQEQKRQMRLKDFYLAVVLKTVGFTLLGLEDGMGEYVTFVFSDPEDKAQAVLNAFWEGKVEVNARELISNINELKTRLHTKIR